MMDDDEHHIMDFVLIFILIILLVASSIRVELCGSQGILWRFQHQTSKCNVKVLMLDRSHMGVVQSG